MKDVYYNPSEYEPSLFESLTDNIKEDRTPEDLLFQIMLDLGVLLSSKIEERVIDGKKVFNVAEGFLIACFDKNVTDETITAIAKQNRIILLCVTMVLKMTVSQPTSSRFLLRIVPIQ